MEQRRSQRTEHAGSILLVGDDQGISTAVAEYLRGAGFRVDHATDREVALRLAGSADPDVIVLDRAASDIDGAELRQPRQRDRQPAPLLLMIARGGGTSSRDVAAADDELAQPFAMQELEARIRALMERGARHLDDEVLQVGDLVLDTVTMRVRRGGRELQLSPISLKLLALLMRESPRVVARGELEREVWGDALPDSDTLRSHLYNLRKAIDRPFDRPLLQTIHSAGYRLAELERESSARSA